MATGYIHLDLAGAVPADGTGTDNDPPVAAVNVSSAAQTAGTPKQTQVQWLCAGATGQVKALMWTFLMPGDYSSGGTIRAECKYDNNTAANFVLIGGIAPVTTASTNDNTGPVFNAQDASAATAVPGTTGLTAQVTIALTVTNVAANRKVTVFVGRDPDHGSDTASTGNLILIACSLEYTTT